ncbi:hypothetical protein TNCV_2962551 [Trichonephila clavipes]|nr:hypothetical protein TNCV_2962551 [Trichonephila clavipes]
MINNIFKSLGLESKHGENDREEFLRNRVCTDLLFWCSLHLEIVTEKIHHPTRAFYDDIMNLRKQVACVKRKAVASQASQKKQWRGRG